MKRILLTITSLLIILTGCGAQTPYEQFVSDIKPLAKTDVLAMSITSTIAGTDSELDGTSFEINYVFDDQNELVKMNLNEVETYMTTDTMYINLFGNWVAQSFSLENFSEIKEAKQFKTAIQNMPDGDTPLAANLTGYKQVDQVIADKTLNQLVIEQSDNLYSITGLETILSADTSNGLVLNLTPTDAGKTTVTFTEAEELELPAETANALYLDSNNSLDGLVNSESI